MCRVIYQLTHFPKSQPKDRNTRESVSIVSAHGLRNSDSRRIITHTAASVRFSPTTLSPPHSVLSSLPKPIRRKYSKIRGESRGMISGSISSSICYAPNHDRISLSPYLRRKRVNKRFLLGWDEVELDRAWTGFWRRTINAIPSPTRVSRLCKGENTRRYPR